MPVVKIDMLAGRTKEQKKKLIADVTAAVCGALSCKPDAVTIIITDVDKENWGAAGKQKE
jgi:4-oxalocrotonate tautomerase